MGETPRGILEPLVKRKPAGMSFLLTDSTKPTEFLLGFTLFWWGLWLIGPTGTYQTILTEYLSWILPRVVWGGIFLGLGLCHCILVARNFGRYWLNEFFMAGQLLLWTFLSVIFTLVQFYTVALVICPIYILASTWVFLRLLFAEETEGIPHA